MESLSSTGTTMISVTLLSEELSCLQSAFISVHYSLVRVQTGVPRCTGLRPWAWRLGPRSAARPWATSGKSLSPLGLKSSGTTTDV